MEKNRTALNLFRKIGTSVTGYRCAIVLFFFVVVGSSPSKLVAASQSYDGDGQIFYRVFSPAEEGVILVEKKYTFHFEYENGRWKICVQEVGESDFEKFEAFNDGTNTYILTTIKKDVFLNKTKELDRLLNTNLVAEIFPINFPPPSLAPLNQIWLAYCSQQFFSQPQVRGLPPLWQIQRPSSFVLHPFVKTSQELLLSNSFGMPKQVSQFCDGVEYGISNDRGRLQINKAFQFPEPYTRGFERLKYQVIETTNIAGNVFAHSFRLVMLKPKDQGKAATELRMLCEYEGFLEKLRVGQSGEKIIVQLEKGASVSDYRALALDQSIESVIYRSPGRDWLPMSEGSLPYELFRQHKSAMGGLSPEIIDKSRKRTILKIGSAITLVSILLPVYFCCWRQNTNKQTKRTLNI